MSTTLYRRDPASAPIGILMTLRVRLSDHTWSDSVLGQHIGAGLILHRDPPEATPQTTDWIVSDPRTGLRLAAQSTPGLAIRSAYRRLIITHGRPADLAGSATVQQAAARILIRVRQALPAILRQRPPGEAPHV